jgi:hypothetical protein
VLLDRGASIPEVAERIGDTQEMVIKVYGKHMPGREDRTRRIIDEFWTDGVPAASSAVSRIP